MQIMQSANSEDQLCGRERAKTPVMYLILVFNIGFQADRFCCLHGKKCQRKRKDTQHAVRGRRGAPIPSSSREAEVHSRAEQMKGVILAVLATAAKPLCKIRSN